MCPENPMTPVAQRHDHGNGSLTPPPSVSPSSPASVFCRVAQSHVVASSFPNADEATPPAHDLAEGDLLHLGLDLLLFFLFPFFLL